LDNPTVSTLISPLPVSNEGVADRVAKGNKCDAWTTAGNGVISAVSDMHASFAQDPGWQDTDTICDVGRAGPR